ncbi:MAG: HDOD domain-containing protein [Deltaproteobacteria bacterium]
MKTQERNLIVFDWSCHGIPTLPPIAERLIAMASDKNASTSEMTELISTDPGLAVRLLKAVNSAFYSLSVEVTSIRHAIVLLGLTEVKRIALSAVIAERFLAVPREAKRAAMDLWRHLVATAVLAQDLSDEDEEPDPYTLGLLHDVGWLLFLVQHPASYVSFLQEKAKGLREAEKLWGVDHQLLGAKLAETWGLPEPFQIVALRHHDPMRDIAPPGYLFKVTFANHLVNEIGFRSHSMLEEPLTPEIFDASHLMDSETYEEIRRAAFADRERIEGYCRLFLG